MEELNTPIKVSFAQNREDIFLEYFLRDVKTGFYVDVGANDPVEDSVTKIFYDKGWSGINIEPIKKYYQKLLVQRPRDINLNIGVSSKNGSTVLREYKKYHGLSTMATEMLDQYEKRKDDSNFDDYVEHTVEVRTLESIFTEYKVGHIHFLKIDVEGLEYEVIKGNNWEKYRPEIICIEANHVLNDWRPILMDVGYSLAFNDGLNEYYVAKESKQRATDFSYIEAVLPAQVVTHKTANAISQLIANNKVEKQILIQKNSELVFKREELESTVIALLNQFQEMNGLKNLIKAFLKRLNSKIEEKIYPLEDRQKVKSVIAPPVAIVDSITEQISLINKYDINYLQQLQLESNYPRRWLLKSYRLVRSVAGYCLRLLLRCTHKVNRLVRGKNEKK